MRTHITVQATDTRTGRAVEIPAGTELEHCDVKRLVEFEEPRVWEFAATIRGHRALFQARTSPYLKP